MTGLMTQDMAEQPAVLAGLVDRFDADVRRVAAVVPEPLAGVVFVARGSSDNAAVFGRYLAELAGGRPAGLAAPSLVTRYEARVDYRGYLAVALSQSGETPEIVTVCERLRAAGARTVGIVNTTPSALADAVELVLPVEAGPERAVPATKTVTGQFLAVAAVARALGALPFGASDLAALPQTVADVLADPAAPRALAERWAGAERLFVAARGLLYAAALETALKVKETARLFAEGISAADLRHGPIAAVDPGVPALVLDDGGPAAPDVRELVAQLQQQRGAPVAVCAPGSLAELSLPVRTVETLTSIPAIVRGQQLAQALAEVRGLDPDAPKGLTKVTATR
jgi:glutamine---fructose-6-phosphate transaminase (isomerizing)